MLYDKRWDAKVETNVDVLKLETLIAWLEKQPATEKYDYNNCNGRCLYGQYLTHHGVSWKEELKHTKLGDPRSDFRDYVYEHVACEKPWTFGAALDRARKLLA